MRTLTTSNSSFAVIIVIAVCVAITALLPIQAAAEVQMEEIGSGDLGGDPNDEQDFSGGGGGNSDGYDGEECEDGIFWGSGGSSFPVPVLHIGGKIMYLVPTWDSPVPMVKIFMISKALSPVGEINVR